MPKRINYTQEHLDTLVKQCEECLEYIDYDNIHKAMVAIDWKWASIEQGCRVPNIMEISYKAREVLMRGMRTIIDNGYKDCFGGTGGFSYRIKYWKKDDIFTVDFYFAVTEWSSGYE